MLVRQDQRETSRTWNIINVGQALESLALDRDDLPPLHAPVAGMTFRERHIAKSLFLLTLAHLSHPTDHKNLQDFVSVTRWMQGVCTPPAVAIKELEMLAHTPR
jgi:hypothetical protein